MASRLSIVPVLDLRGGEVVHARAGDRARYRPIRSKLAASSAPDAVLQGLLSLAPFRAIYIADLDAIERRGDHRRLVADLAQRADGVAFWIDGGIGAAAEAAAFAAAGLMPVLGSETLTSVQELAAAQRQLGNDGFVLSLDYRGDRLLGPPGLDAMAEYWPDRVIAMTLARVGTGAGPDIARLDTLMRVAGGRSVYAAGGVRDRADLEALAAIDVAGALVASALHDGSLSRETLAAFMGKRAENR